MNAMRSFTNGTFKSGDVGGMPPRNSERVPLFTAPAPHIMKMANPEKMLRKFYVPVFYFNDLPRQENIWSILSGWKLSHVVFRNVS